MTRLRALVARHLSYPHHRLRRGHREDPVAFQWGEGAQSRLCRRCIRIAVLWDARHDAMAAGRRIGGGAW